MSQFTLYFQLGIEHILDILGYDHIMFVVALTAIYLLREWKRLLMLVTAFTIGHSITLALATLQVVKFDSELIEFLIPVTIFITAISNLFKKDSFRSHIQINTNYVFALFFGLIHGLGFSNYLISLLGTDTTIVPQLLAFNIGLEVGQIIIVGSFLFISFIFVSIFGISRRDWNLIISSAVAGIAITIILETKFW